MTVMIGTTELARRLYDAWRQQQDLINPVEEAAYDRRGPRFRPRRKFEHISTAEREVWKAVAEEAGRVMADAMGALP